VSPSYKRFQAGTTTTVDLVYKIFTLQKAVKELLCAGFQVM